MVKMTDIQVGKMRDYLHTITGCRLTRNIPLEIQHKLGFRPHRTTALRILQEMADEHLAVCIPPRGRNARWYLGKENEIVKRAYA